MRDAGRSLGKSGDDELGCRLYGEVEGWKDRRDTWWKLLDMTGTFGTAWDESSSLHWIAWTGLRPQLAMADDGDGGRNKTKPGALAWDWMLLAPGNRGFDDEAGWLHLTQVCGFGGQRLPVSGWHQSASGRAAGAGDARGLWARVCLGGGWMAGGCFEMHLLYVSPGQFNVNKRLVRTILKISLYWWNGSGFSPAAQTGNN